MPNINIKAKLKAYTKIDNIITDAPKDGEIYGRKDGEWEKIKIEIPLSPTEIQPTEPTENGASGLNIEKLDINNYRIGIRKWENSKEEFEKLTHLQSDTTYYVREATPNVFINGGTAFDDGTDGFIQDYSSYNAIIRGGSASTTVFTEEYHTTNARGEEI